MADGGVVGLESVVGGVGKVGESREEREHVK